MTDLPHQLETREARRAMGFAVIATLAIVAGGLIASMYIAPFKLDALSMFFIQFAAMEPIHLAVTGTVVTVAGVVLRRSTAVSTFSSPVFNAVRRPRLTAALLALTVFGVAAVGTWLIFRGYFLADDEHSAWFQAVIFAHGQHSAVVPPEWCPWIESLAPTSVKIDGPCGWRLPYLPVHSAVRALFHRAGVDALTGPTIAAASVLLVMGIAREAWPDRPERAWIGGALLAVSTQVLLMSMTMYAMPTHLLLALLWLWLYVRDERWSLVLLPWVGFLAIGVHSPFPHLLLVPIFWLRYLRRRRFAAATYIAIVYAIALIVWQQVMGGWFNSGPSAASAVVTVKTAAGVSAGVLHTVTGGLGWTGSFFRALIHLMNAALIATWNSPVVLPSCLVALLAWKRLDSFGRDLGVSLILMVLVRVALSGDQGEGWGYRYMYAGLGNLALLAALGVEVIAQAVGTVRARQLLIMSVATSLLLQLPLRGVQVRQIIDPWYRTYEYLRSQPAQVVVFPAYAAAWGRQLLRNDPFLRNTPKLMDAASISPESLLELERRYPGQVRIVTAAELLQFGLPKPITYSGNVFQSK